MRFVVLAVVAGCGAPARPAARVANVAPPMELPLEIAGRVIDQDAHDGLAGAAVLVVISRAEPLMALSDDRGAFHIANVPPGTRHVIVYFMDQSKELDVVVPSAQATSLELGFDCSHLPPITMRGTP